MILHHDRNPWFSEDIIGQLREALPDARYEPITDGPINRPDETAAAVRRITAGG